MKRELCTTAAYGLSLLVIGCSNGADRPTAVPMQRTQSVEPSSSQAVAPPARKLTSLAAISPGIPSRDGLIQMMHDALVVEFPVHFAGVSKTQSGRWPCSAVQGFGKRVANHRYGSATVAEALKGLMSEAALERVVEAAVNCNGRPTRLSNTMGRHRLKAGPVSFAAFWKVDSIPVPYMVPTPTTQAYLDSLSAIADYPDSYTDADFMNALFELQSSAYENDTEADAALAYSPINNAVDVVHSYGYYETGPSPFANVRPSLMQRRTSAQTPPGFSGLGECRIDTATFCTYHNAAMFSPYFWSWGGLISAAFGGCLWGMTVSLTAYLQYGAPAGNVTTIVGDFLVGCGVGAAVAVVAYID
jgi:hypothetical protein